MSEQIVLYDLKGKNGPWSPNTWKTRYCLNYKGLPFKTEWIEYIDIEQACKGIGGAPTGMRPDGTDRYTVPFIYDPNTKSAVSDSFIIALYLDKIYPDTPKLIPVGTEALHAAFQDVCYVKIGEPVFYALVLQVNDQLSSKSAAARRKSKEHLIGRLEDVSPPGPKRDEHWAKIREGFGQVAAWLDQNGNEKQFFMGDTISVADFTIAGNLKWIQIIMGAEHDEWKAVISWDGGRWAAYLRALEKLEGLEAIEDIAAGK